jgi:DMSO/TMAO reductase YedYZ molybdopterin-dependent catalytic subunit
MTNRCAPFVLACLLVLFAMASALAGPALLEVTGHVEKTLALDRSDLLALARHDYAEQRTMSQDGKDARLDIHYQGVPLKELLDRTGLRPDRREIRKAIVLLTAEDGYQASFSWGELYNSALGDEVIVVLRQGSDELLDTDGLPGLRSLQDMRPGPRHVRWLTRVEVEQFALPITNYAKSYFLTARLAARRMLPNRLGVIMTVTALPARLGTPMFTEDRTHCKKSVPIQGASACRRLRLHRAVLQPEKTSFDDGVRQSDRLRESSKSLGRCPRNRQQPTQAKSRARLETGSPGTTEATEELWAVRRETRPPHFRSRAIRNGIARYERPARRTETAYGPAGVKQHEMRHWSRRRERRACRDRRAFARATRA